MSVAVVLDLVSTLDAHVLVLVLVHRVSSVVLVLGEIVVVVDPCEIAVSMVATRTVVAHIVFAAETCCLGTPCLERSSGSSRSAGDAIRNCAFASVSSSEIV